MFVVFISCCLAVLYCHLVTFVFRFGS